MKDLQQVQCYECHGQGYIRIAHDIYLGFYQKITCDYCWGEGLLLEEVDIDLDPNDLLKELVNV